MSGLDLLDDDDAPRGPAGGLVIATVSNVDDPDGLGRVKVVFPTISGAVESDWARVLAPFAGAGADGPRGAHLPFAVKDEVVVGFLGGHGELPVVVGALFSKQQPPPVPADRLSVHAVLQSRRGHALRLDDTDGAEKIEIVAAGAKNALTIGVVDGDGDGKVAITAARCVEIKVGDDITLTLRDGEVTLTCKKFTVKDAAEVNLGGGQVAVEADQSLTLTGGGGINLNNGALEVSS